MRRFIRLKASPRRETFTGTFLIQRREVVAMHTVALTFVRSSAVADDVAQEARRDALRSLDRFEGSPRQQRPYAPEPHRSATGKTPVSKSPGASARQANGVLRRTDGSLPHQAMALGFAAETRDPLARN
jgi:hypothetical protein